MNTKAVFTISVLASLVGCASTDMTRYPNVKLDGEKHVAEVAFSYPKTGPTKTLKTCVTQVVNNKDIDIQDSRNAVWVVATPLMLLMPNTKSTVKGGDVVVSASDDQVVAVGSVAYQITVGMPEFFDLQP